MPASQQTTYTANMTLTAAILNSEFGEIYTWLNTQEFIKNLISTDIGKDLVWNNTWGVSFENAAGVADGRIYEDSSNDIIISGSGGILVQSRTDIKNLPQEYHYVISNIPSSTTSTSYSFGTPTGHGARVNFDNFSGGAWYFEVVIGISNVLGIVSVELYSQDDATVVVGSEVTFTGATDQTLERSIALTLPTTTTNAAVIARVKTNNASYTATVSMARLIYITN